MRPYPRVREPSLSASAPDYQSMDNLADSSQTDHRLQHLNQEQRPLSDLHTCRQLGLPRPPRPFPPRTSSLRNAVALSLDLLQDSSPVLRRKSANTRLRGSISVPSSLEGEGKTRSRSWTFPQDLHSTTMAQDSEVTKIDPADNSVMQAPSSSQRGAAGVDDTSEEFVLAPETVASIKHS